MGSFNLHYLPDDFATVQRTLGYRTWETGNQETEDDGFVEHEEEQASYGGISELENLAECGLSFFGRSCDLDGDSLFVCLRGTLTYQECDNEGWATMRIDVDDVPNPRAFLIEQVDAYMNFRQTLTQVKSLAPQATQQENPDAPAAN